jgi:hypothetical protein
MQNSSTSSLSNKTTDCESNVLTNTLQMYEVKVGRGRIERIHAFDLYKFNRNFQKTSKEIAPFQKKEQVHKIVDL